MYALDSDIKRYNENDGYVGFWINGAPYYVIGATYLSSGRLYIDNSDLLKSLQNNSKLRAPQCQRVLEYFSVAPKIGNGNKSIGPYDIYMEGRRYYLTKGDTITAESKNKVTIPNISLNDKLCVSLSQFNGAKIYVHSLVCSQLGSKDTSSSSGDSWVKLLSSLTSESDKGQLKESNYCSSLCTEIGCKIAKSLIKIAALRIFAEPEQSIMELPVNSIDSYYPEARVGKFGMGFFSFLYWLIGHPLRKLYIYSWSKDASSNSICGYCATVSDSPNGLTLTLKILETCVTKTGTLMYLDCGGDKFDDQEVFRFGKQVERLEHTSLVKIYYASPRIKLTTPDTQMFATTISMNDAKKSKDAVYVFISVNKIFVEDYAQGLPIHILLGSLFVPSISTKTIKDSVKVYALPKIDVSLNKKSFGTFEILVSGVSVIKLNTPPSAYEYSKGTCIINMPSWTRLPVSRDDIILDTPTVSKYFEDSLLQLLELGAKQYDVTLVQKSLHTYFEYTVNPVNKQCVTNALSTFTEKYKSLLVKSSFFHTIELNTVGKKMSILSDTMYVSYVETRLLDTLSKFMLTDIWFGKRVILSEGVQPSVNTQGMSSVVFVNKSLKNDKIDWPVTCSQANPTLNLNPIGTNYGKDKNNTYQTLVPPIKDSSRTLVCVNTLKSCPKDDDFKFHRELYLSVLAVCDGLKVKFKVAPTFLRDFNVSYKNMYTILGVDAWTDISYTLLNKFTSFKGNETYGGGQYELILGHTWSELSFTNIASPEMKSYYVQSIIETIKSIKESQQTKLVFTTFVSPSSIYNEFNTYLVFANDFNNFLIERTHTLVDYTICSVSLIIAIYQSRYNMFNYNYVLLTRIALIILNKVKSIRYTDEDLRILYRATFGQPGQSIPTMGVPISLNILQLISQTKFLLEISMKTNLPFPYTFKNSTTGGTSVRISQLIGYLFSNDVQTIPNDASIFTEASKYKGSAKLQITEIAINEGTTKDFISASLTEMVQNSVDAIRLSDSTSRTININFGVVDNDTYAFMVEDFVGMPPSAFLYVSIPFLSTKTPSEIVTGEMGSGFFNVYRESSLVVIDTVYNGVNYVSYDTPIIENGRVIDVLKHISISNTIRINGTKIIVKSRSFKDNPEVISESIATLRYTTESVLSQVSLFNDISVKINTQDPSLRSTDKTHMFSIGYFDVYFIEGSKYPSYIFTKGIPFAPLANYYTKYNKDVLVDIETSIIVNIRHGGYTPVQSRTKLILPDNIKEQFDKLLSYVVFVKEMYLYKNDTNSYRTYMYPNMKSTAQANQLLFTAYATYINEPPPSFLMYLNFDFLDVKSSIHNTLADNTNELIYKLGDDDPRDVDVLNRLKRELLKMKLSPFPEVRKLGEYLLLKWISNKNMSVIKSPTKKVKGKDGKVIEMRDYKPEKEDTLMSPYVRIWLETFRDKAIHAKIHGWVGSKGFDIRTGENEEEEHAAGYFDKTKNLLYINTVMWKESDRDDIIKQIKNVKSTFDFQNISNSRWAQYFTFRYPATVLPHELEHYRRKQSHDGSAHDVTRVALWEGDIATERTYDQSCNDVFSKVISEGFYDELLKRYKAAKLVG